MIFRLYFPVHMRDRNIDILQFVEKDLKEVMQDREFDQLTDDQKRKGNLPASRQMDRPRQRNRQTHEQLCRKKPGYIKTDS